MKIKDIVELTQETDFQIYNYLIYEYELIYDGRKVPENMLNFEVRGMGVINDKLVIFVKE